MNGKCYYMTTLDAWQRHAPRFASSHFVVLATPSAASTTAPAISPITAIDANPPSGVPVTASAKSSHAEAPGICASSISPPGISVVISGATSGPNPPADLVRREEAHAYPTDFSAMSEVWIDRLSLRGEQLTLCLARAYIPDLISEESPESDDPHAD